MVDSMVSPYKGSLDPPSYAKHQATTRRSSSRLPLLLLFWKVSQNPLPPNYLTSPPLHFAFSTGPAKRRSHSAKSALCSSKKRFGSSSPENDPGLRTRRVEAAFSGRSGPTMVEGLRIARRRTLRRPPFGTPRCSHGPARCFGVLLQEWTLSKIPSQTVSSLRKSTLSSAAPAVARGGRNPARSARSGSTNPAERLGRRTPPERPKKTILGFTNPP